MVKGKSTRGRQRIEMKRIKSEEARQVCFSKRRPSLFKKASELSTLCGAEVAVVTFSPGGKCFSFGHPSALSVANRFAEQTLDDHIMGSGSHGNQGLTGTSEERNQGVMELQQLLEIENRRKKGLVEAIERESGGPVMQLLDAKVSALGIHELEKLRKGLCMVQNMVKERSQEVLQDARQTRRLAPESRMNMAAVPSQVFSGDLTAGSMYTTFPSSSNAPHDGLHINSELHGSLDTID